jgi:hypothetical protein
MSSNFYGVTFNRQYSKWIAVLNKKYIGIYETEREAAIRIDVALIKGGMKPRNILKPLYEKRKRNR